MEFTVTWREPLIAIVLAALLYVFVYLLLLRRGRGGDAKPAGEATEATSLKAEIETLQQRLDAIEIRLGMTDSEEVETAHAAYDYAVQYARQGMIAPEIAARCGISRDEAALIVAMQRNNPEP